MERKKRKEELQSIIKELIEWLLLLLLFYYFHRNFNKLLDAVVAFAYCVDLLGRELTLLRRRP